jgi:hypothetical protein
MGQKWVLPLVMPFFQKMKNVPKRCQNGAKMDKNAKNRKKSGKKNPKI